MKRKILVIIMGILLLTGCTMSESIDMNISKDKQMNLSLEMLFDREFIEGVASMSDVDLTNKTNEEALDWLLENQSTDEDSNKYEENGYELKKIVESDEKIGIKYSITINSIDDLINNGETISLDTIDEIKNHSLFSKLDDEYTLKINKESSTEESTDLSSYTSQGLELTEEFVLHLPVKATHSNASSISDDGKTLKWNLLKTDSVEATFTLKKDIITIIKELFSKNTYLLIGSCAAILIAIIIIILSISNKKNNGEPQINNKSKTLNPKKALNMPDLMAADPNEVRDNIISAENETFKNNDSSNNVNPNLNSFVNNDIIPNEGNNYEEPNLSSFVNVEKNDKTKENTSEVIDAFGQQPEFDKTINDNINSNNN